MGEHRRGGWIGGRHIKRTVMIILLLWFFLVCFNKVKITKLLKAIYEYIPAYVYTFINGNFCEKSKFCVYTHFKETCVQMKIESPLCESEILNHFRKYLNV